MPTLCVRISGELRCSQILYQCNIEFQSWISDGCIQDDYIECILLFFGGMFAMYAALADSKVEIYSRLRLQTHLAGYILCYHIRDSAP